MHRHDGIFKGLAVVILAFFCALSAGAQDNPQKLSPTPPSPARASSSRPAQNFHQWGAVTLFNGLPSDVVRAIAQTPDGVLWFGTDSGLARFDGRRVQTAAAGEDAAAKKILALEVAADGALWVGTQQGALRYRNGRFERIEHTGHLAVTAILFGDGVLLASENGEILRLTETGENSFRAERIPYEPLLGGDGQPLKITSLADAGGRRIAGTRGRSILLVEGNRTFETFGQPRPFFVNSLSKDGAGAVWLGADAKTGDSGLFLLEDLARPQKVGSGLGNVLTIKPGEQGGGGVWVGTQNRGLFRFRGREQVEQFTFENTAGGLRSDTVHALLVDREGVVWVGTNRGVCRYDASSPLNKTLSENVNSNFVRTLFKARDGRVFAGTNRGLFERSGENWVETPAHAQKVVYALHEDPSGQMLVGTPAGLFGLDNKQKLAGDVRAVANFQGKTYAAVFGAGVVRLDDQEQIAPGESLPTALSAEADKLWVGTAKNGVFVFDGRETKQEKALENLRGTAIRKIGKGGENNYWFAGEGGLFLYRDGNLEKIVSDQNVRDVVGGADEAWAATEDGGLVHVRRDPTHGWLAASLNVEQGLPSQKTFSILPDAERLLVASNRGIVEYLPGRTPPKVIAARVLSQRLHAAEELAQTIQLNYPQNSLLVEVAGLSSRTFPEQFQYGFLLRNARGEVLEKRLSVDSQFTAAGLAAGDYSIEARVFNKDLVASEPLVFRFSIARAPFPMTEAALGVLLTITVIALIWAVFEHSRMMQRNRELTAARFDLANEAERERKRIARDLHDQTLADLRKLMLMSDKLPSDTSEFRSEIEAVSTEIRRICEDLSPSVLENVGLLAALEFLLSRTIENYTFSADEPEEELNFPPAVQMQIYRVAQEVLTNIKRHGDAKTVWMKVSVSEPEGFVLSIGDDGTAGFDPGSAAPKGRGIANIRARAALIKSEIAWRPGQSGGTIFELKKPLS